MAGTFLPADGFPLLSSEPALQNREHGGHVCPESLDRFRSMCYESCVELHLGRHDLVRGGGSQLL